MALRYDDPVHIKVKVAAYPAKKENAVEVVRGLIEESLSKKGKEDG
jgi:RNA binding exosome subunit